MLIWWEQGPSRRTRPGTFVAAFDRLASHNQTFSFPIHFLKPML
jgi:hypothetical protein